MLQSLPFPPDSNETRQGDVWRVTTGRYQSIFFAGSTLFTWFPSYECLLPYSLPIWTRRLVALKREIEQEAFHLPNNHLEESLLGSQKTGLSCLILRFESLSEELP